MVEQPFLTPDAAGIAGKGAVGPDHAVTGHDDGNIVPPVRGRHSPGGFRISLPDGQLDITDGPAKRDHEQLGPYVHLETGTGLCKRQLKYFTVTVEILDQLVHTACNNRRQLFIGLFGGRNILEGDTGDAGIGAGDLQLAKG